MEGLRRGRQRKGTEEEACTSKPKKKQICIVHSELSKCDHFTLLSDLPNPEEKLKYIREISDLRLSQPTGSKERLESVCHLVPTILNEDHGYHRDCYKIFTRHLDRLKTAEEVPTTAAKVGKRRNSGDKVTLFAKDCIFCNKVGKVAVKKSGSWTTENTQTFMSDGWKTVLENAENKSDEKLLVRIRGHDLFASEAHFHATCRRKYLVDPGSWKSTDSEATTYQEELEEAHESAFLKVCEKVSKEVLNDKKVLKLTDLLQIYIDSLENTDFANPNYRSAKLKSKLEAKYGDEIVLSQLNIKGKFVSQLVYSKGMKLESAVQSAFLLGSEDTMKDTAVTLRNAIVSAFESSDDLAWPPTADKLNNTDDVIPSELNTFLKLLFSGKVEDSSTQINRLANSIGQDICRAVTNGEWKLPKHTLVCMYVRHLYRSKQLTTLLNRLGHSESHSFAIELETAVAKALEESSSLLTPQIVRDPAVASLFHSEFDNFDQLVNTMTGSGSIHTAHGIMLQEVLTEGSDDHGGVIPAVPSTSRSKERSLNLQIQEELPDCYVGQRKSPSYPVLQKLYPGCEGSVRRASEEDMIWVFLRVDRSSTGQEVPAWTGFVSVTGSKPHLLTTIDYYPVINHPITDYRTVQECLRFAEEATLEVGQMYTVTTFDLGVCMKALPLIWKNPVKYKRHIVMIGTFHLVCAYLHMIGKKMAGSGMADVMLEAGLIGSGSVQGVLTGKHYERAMHCHKILLESLERLLFEQFLIHIQEGGIFTSLPDDSRRKIQEVIENPSREMMDELMADEHFSAFVKKYFDYKQRVRDGGLGKTAQFWMSYMDHIWLVLAIIRAVKCNDFMLYAECLHLMADLFFSFDGQNYARYLTYFSTFIANLEESYPGATELLKRGAISVARSFIPGNRCAVDKTMEETFMKHAKSHSGTGESGAGVSGIASNYNAYQRWVRTTHERSKYVEATLNLADMLTDSGSSSRHRDLRPVEIQRSDQEVCETQEAICGFTNPFTLIDKDHLYCLSSGARVPVDNEHDILEAESKGKKAKDVFIKDRLEKHENFFEPVKRLNLKTMEDMGKKVKVKSIKNKVVEYRQQGNVAIQLLVRSQAPDIQLDLADLMKYPLTPVPFSIGTADGCMAKTDKSKALKHLIDGIDNASVPPQDKTLLLVEDGNALFHSMKEIPGNFKQIAEKLFNMTSQKVDIIFSTDMYKVDSVKTMERVRRGCSDKLLIQGENTKKPADWKAFLTNEDNKKQLVQIMYKAWNNDAYASKLQHRQIVLICEGEAFQFTSEDGRTVRTTIDALKSTQEETDTRIVLYCLYAKDQGYKTVQVKTPDSDIFFILLHYMKDLGGITVLFDTGYGNRRKLINLTELSRAYTEEYRSALLGLHAYCGCDSTSAFKGRGHLIPLKTLQKMPRFVASLARLGNTWNVTQDLLNDLEEFTCAMYGNSRFSSVDNLRLFKIKEKCDGKPTSAMRNVDMGSLPPCRMSLIQHVRRVNYQVSIWKCAHITQPDIPAASDGHGWTLVNGILEPLWINGDLLLPRLVDILQETIDAESEDEVESDEEANDLSE